MSNFIYCTEFVLGKTLKIKDIALRFVYCGYDTLFTAKIPSWHVRRTTDIAFESPRISNEQVPPVLSILLQKRA